MRTLFKNAILYEQEHPLHQQKSDILIENDVIVAIAPDLKLENDHEIDMTGHYVSAGWIDIHVHAFVGKSPIGTHADMMGIDKGIPIIVDAGTAGAANIDVFYDYAQTQATKIYAFINISKIGLDSLHELVDLNNIDDDALRTKVAQHPEFIRGIKVRESGSVVGQNGVLPLERAQQLAKQLKLPIMVHIGNTPPELEAVIACLKPGDIVTHCFHGKKNVNIINEQATQPHVHQFIQQAKQNDVLFDIGHGTDSFSFKTAQVAIEEGFLPDTISTDMYHKNMIRPVGGLDLTMAKLHTAGMSIANTIDAVTKNAAAAIRLADRYGTLALGKEAVLTFFDITEQKRKCYDSMNEVITLERQIKTVGCYINGTYFMTK